MIKLKCSRCRKMLPEESFSPKPHHQTTHINAAGEDVTYRNPSKRGRHYWCKACRLRRYHETKDRR